MEMRDKKKGSHKQNATLVKKIIAVISVNVVMYLFLEGENAESPRVDDECRTA